MKKYIKSASTDTGSYKDYWAYKEVSNNWESDVVTRGDKTTVTIWFDKKDKDVYGKFLIVHDTEDNGGIYQVFNITDGARENITDSFDFCSTLDECIRGCFYYFHTRY